MERGRSSVRRVIYLSHLFYDAASTIIQWPWLHSDQGSTSAQSGKIPVPIGLFPLEKMNGTRNVLDTQLVILNSKNVGFHSRQILPLKFIGNARFTSIVNSYLSLDVLGREKVFQKSEITVLVWIDLHEKLNQEFVLMVIRPWLHKS